jgi:hypothetical protein
MCAQGVKKGFGEAHFLLLAGADVGPVLPPFYGTGSYTAKAAGVSVITPGTHPAFRSHVPMDPPSLSLLETRVLSVLVEKQHTVPDTYPLSLAALTAGCNQKSSRDPVIEVREADVRAALDRLKALSLVIESSGGRVMRYAHNVERVLRIPGQAVALLAVLMLRGPQTVGELRINCERLHRFADLSAVEAFLHELAARSAGALVAELRRQPGAREIRWAHLLSGLPVESAPAIPAGEPGHDAVSASEVALLRASVARLETELAALKTTVAKLCAELGVPAP